MSKDLQKWTKHFLEKGYDIIEARVKANNRINFKKDCDNLSPKENKVDKYVYTK